MKSDIKKIVSVILCMVLLFSTASVAFATDGNKGKVIDSGFCGAEGENLVWTFYDSGELVISGEGEMESYYVDYSEDNYLVSQAAPWHKYSDKIRIITIEEGVTSVGNHAFYFEKRLYYKLTLPQSMVYFENDPFYTDVKERIGYQLAVDVSGWNNSQNAVRKIQVKNIEYVFNEEETQVIEFIKTPTSSAPKFVNALFDQGDKVLLSLNVANNETTSRQLKKGETAELSIYYYTDYHTDAEIVWDFEGDGCDVEYIESGLSGEYTKIRITAVRYGEFTVKVRLVDADGTVLIQRKQIFFSDIPEDKTFEDEMKELGETIEEQFHMAGFTAFFTTFFILLPILFAPLEPIWFLIALIKGDIKL